MNGLEIKDIRGEGRVVKAEFEPGPLQLGSTTKVEREVVVHLSLEGGPDFSGMVYFC